MCSKKVFLSFLPDTEPFVKAFSNYFFTYDAHLQEISRSTEPGQIPKTELANRIGLADVFIAFVGADYSRLLAHEFEQVVSGRRNGRYPKIVPITLCQSGKNWWDEFKARVGFEFDDKPFYQAGKESWLEPEPQAVQGIRKWVLEAAVATTSTASPRRLVILGHPTVKLSDPVREATDKLIAEVNQCEISSTHWPDKWAKPSSQDLSQESALFLQPVSIEDVPDLLQRPADTAGYLSMAATEESRPVLDKSQIMFWLPKGEKHDEFEKRTVNRKANPSFRSDSVSDLAKYLMYELGRDWQGPILTLESIDESVEDSEEVRERLPEEIFGCVENYLSEQKYYVEFPPDEFESLFDDIATRRPILVAHDLKVSFGGMTGRRPAWQEIQRKFTDVQERADKVLKSKGLGTKDVFWVACISNGHHDRPRSSHLPTYSLKRWKILELNYDSGKLLPVDGSRQKLDEALRLWARKE